MLPCPRHFRRPLPSLWAAALVGSLAACIVSDSGPDQQDYRYSRNRVQVYESLDPHAPVLAELKYDTEAVVIDRHRSFLKIQIDGQLEGWADGAHMLERSLRERVRTLTAVSAHIPSQGAFLARDTLNVHVQPYRWSPTFYQLRQDERFHVLDRMLVDRLPMSAGDPTTATPQPTGIDYWYLVRVPRIDRAGWLIGNMAYAGIPLEVAMLAQGRTIVAYFPIGSVEDESLGETKTSWLWVQSSERGQTHDFDRLSVFHWQASRDRYLVIRRNSGLKGYLPIEIVPNLKTRRGEGTGFSILFEKDGQLHRRAHLYSSGRVSVTEEIPVVGAPRLVPPGGFGSRYQFVPPAPDPQPSPDS